MQNQAPGKATRGKLTKVVIPNDEGRQSDLWRWAWFRKSAQRILRALHKIAGKEVRARIEEKIEPES
jgi:hypothetical protein